MRDHERVNAYGDRLANKAVFVNSNDGDPSNGATRLAQWRIRRAARLERMHAEAMASTRAAVRRDMLGTPITECTGCRYALTKGGTLQAPNYNHFFCDEPVEPGFSYCPPHRKLCRGGPGVNIAQLEAMIHMHETTITVDYSGRNNDHTEAVDEELRRSPE